MAYVNMYRVGLLNDNLLPMTSSFEKAKDAEVKRIIREIEKREGVASVREQINPWLPLVTSTSSAQWWCNELRISGLGSFVMLTQMEMPHLEYSETLFDPDSGPRLFSIIPGTPSTFSAEELISARHYTRRIFAIFYGTRMDWNDLDFSYLFMPMSHHDDSEWVERRAWADDLRPAGGVYNSREHVLAKATDFVSKFTCASDVYLVYDRGHRFHGFYRFLGWRCEQLSEDEEEEVLKRYRNSKGEYPELRYPLILAVPQHNRMNFLIPQGGSQKQQELVYLLPQFTSIVLVSDTDARLSLVLPSILRAVLIKLVANSLQEVLSQKSPEIQSVSLDLIKTALVAPAANADRKSTRLNSSHSGESRMPSSA